MKLEKQELQALGQRILTKAGFKIGGARLAEYLGVSDSVLTEWIAGKSMPPVAAILKCVDLIAGDDDSAPPPLHPAGAPEAKPSAQND